MDHAFQPSTALEQDHRRIDRDLSAFHAGLGSGEWRPEPFSRAAAALRRHIYLEEEILFPALRSAGMVAPVAVMVREHGEIWEALDGIERAVAEGGDPAGALPESTRLHTILGAHNFKEEQALYPTADRALGPGHIARLQEALESLALPPGWRCEALGGGNAPAR